MLQELLGRPFEGARLLLLETPGGAGLASLPRASAALALVGPAGGWEAWEAGLLREVGFVAVTLGPRILRAETAAIATIAALQLLWGDLG
jgi:16S rRNA (uracil1498-N3)-methyltransferase